jgi:hypothetical protein
MTRAVLAVLAFAGALAAPSLPSATSFQVPPDVPIGLSWRSVGPGGTGTRIVDIGGTERAPLTFIAL